MPLNPGRHIGFQCFVLGMAGLVSFAAAAFNLSFFIDNRRMRPIVYLLGRQRARFFVAIVGLTLAVISAEIWLANRG